MKKILRSLTIIPDDLYVERAADRQLAGIISNMGRPGYVLVARQMGKTNLLLHARRRSTDDDLFVYMDLSNSFPDIRSFLRNIVDVAAEVTGTFSEAIHQIRVARSNLDRLPHKEHEWELRTLLGDIKGNLVICLDEIDSLTKSEYSDQVFSFIRSVYFSGRANFPELERLTYILSGVAEPSDIIKNRDISPFNIGEKILLQDFTISELEQLIERSTVSIPKQTVDRIFDWTAGHPRMSWDICAQLEDLSNSGCKLEPSSVDQIVRDLYFAEVNMPPVDQVKRIAEDSIEIRDALISVHYGRGDSIPEATRKKLYLAGICQAPQAATVRFKNKVLEESLSERFLLAITHDKLATPIHAGEHAFNAGDLENAISSFNAALKGAQDVEDASTIGLARYWLGRSKFALDDLEAASTDFSLAASNLSGEHKLLSSFYLGHIHLARKLYKDARLEFENVVQNSASGALALEASVDLASCLVAVDPLDKGSAAEELCKKVTQASGEILNAPGQERMGGDTLAMAHYILAEIHLRRARRTEAMKEAELGLETASLDVQVRLTLLQADAQPEKRDFFLSKAKMLILAGATVEEGAPTKYVSLAICRDLLIRLERASRASEAIELVEYILSSATSELDLLATLDSLTLEAIHHGALELAARLFDMTLKNHAERFSDDNIRRLVATLSNIAPERSFAYSNNFLDIIERQGSKLTAIELPLLNSIVFYSTTTQNFKLVDRALALLNIEPQELGLISQSQLSSWKLFKDYLELYSALVFRPTSHTFEQALNLFRNLQNSRTLDLPHFKSDSIVSMLRTLEQELKLNAEVFGEVRRVRKIGRNEVVRVQYGSKIKEGKYKHFIADLENGRCALIDSV